MWLAYYRESELPECERCAVLTDAKSFGADLNCGSLGIYSRYLDKQSGYMRLRVNKRLVKEHVFVMETKLRRRLVPPETVHHKNTIRHDNRPENLELKSSAHGRGGSVAEIFDWCKEFIRQYEKELEWLKS